MIWVGSPEIESIVTDAEVEIIFEKWYNKAISFPKHNGNSI